jgi:hypothetical protein
MVVEQRAHDPIRGRIERLRRAARESLTGWRPAYFYGYVPLALRAEVLSARASSRLTRRKSRALARIVTGERSPLSFAWLATRPLRALFGRGETLGAEIHLAKGILWRHIVALRTRGRDTPEGSGHDSSLPAVIFEQKRLRRWRELR